MHLKVSNQLHKLWMGTTQIITLIAQDIKRYVPINGLDSIELTDNDRYTLGIDFLVADMMGYQDGKVPHSFSKTKKQEQTLYPNFQWNRQSTIQYLVQLYQYYLRRSPQKKIYPNRDPKKTNYSL